MKYPCPCCGHHTFDRPPGKTYGICSVCFWEDDPLQLNDPSLSGGANAVSLNEARENFKKFGACEKRFAQKEQETPMEIERKFTIKEMPENLSGYPFHIIEQAYLCTDPVIRIRREDERYYMTYKGKGLLAREEYNLPLNAEAYAHLLPKADGNVISKKRYLIPLGNQPPAPDSLPSPDGSAAPNGRTDGSAPSATLTVELDVFSAPFDGLIIAEVEFSSVEAANTFVPPAWFDADVTNNPAYHNSNLSKRRL